MYYVVGFKDHKSLNIINRRINTKRTVFDND